MSSTDDSTAAYARPVDVSFGIAGTSALSSSPTIRPEDVSFRIAGRSAFSSPTMKTERLASAGESELLEAVLAEPDRDLPRLVYADWLQQRSEPRGELISLQLALAHLPPRDRKRRELQVRAEDLLDKHRAEWAPQHGTYTYERGFAKLWRVSAEKFLKHAPRVFATEPIHTLDISKSNWTASPSIVSPLCERPELSKIQRLEVRGMRIPVAIFEEFIGLPSLADLRELDLKYAQLSKSFMEALTQRAAFSKLEVLNLSHTVIDDRFGFAFAASPFADSLRVLDLSNTAIGADGLLAITATTGLRALKITGCKLGRNAKAVKAVMKARFGMVLVA